MTLLGLSDGDDAGTGHGSLDIVDFILQGCTNVDNNLKELFRRVAFNISVGNSDDYFRKLVSLRHLLLRSRVVYAGRQTPDVGNSLLRCTNNVPNFSGEATHDTFSNCSHNLKN